MANPKMPEKYSGRLAADGEGNLIAEEGEWAGYPVALHDGQYVFVLPGEKSHNERHHSGDTPEIVGTTDDDADDQPHHLGVLEDDPHYEEGATDMDGNVTNTRTRRDPDIIASRITGHTDAYEGREEE